MTSSNILVTGGAGYIGSHVCKALAKQGYTPIAYDNLYTGNAEAVKWGPLEQGDIRDKARLAEVMAKYQPAAVMHFAALIQVGESVNNPSTYYDNNVLGSLTLLEAARAAKVKNMVFSSTAAVYGMPQTSPISEDHPKAPINPYGNTKLAMENMIRDFSTAYGLDVAILRYFNAAGADPEGELGTAYKVETHIIPLLMRVASGLQPEIKLFGTDYKTPDGTAVRDYIHVTDLAEAHVLALKHLMDGKGSLTLNLGTTKGHSVAETLSAARSVTGETIDALECPRRPGDPDVLVADATRAREVLGWTPQHSTLESIIGSAWAWRKLQNEYGHTGAFTRTTAKKDAA